MAARAMWKGTVRVGSIGVPVKLYAALEDRNVHFRMLHAADHAPVEQILVNPETEESVAYRDALRAFVTDDAELVVLGDDELESLDPEPSREIRIAALLPAGAIDHRWYRRPYYLGPGDGRHGDYFALIGALDRSGREGLAYWTMRKKEYAGALRLHRGYPMLLALHRAEEVIAVDELDPPSGPELDDRELDMARKLLDMYSASFEPGDYHDAYRARVEELIQAKAAGEEIESRPATAARPTKDLREALEASLEGAREGKRA